MTPLMRMSTFAMVAFAVVCSGNAGRACTGITLKPRDGAVVFARTLEFASDLKSYVIIMPRGQRLTGTAPDNKPGLRWTSRYGVVGTNAFDLPIIIDGLNEAGLHVGLFYFPGFAGYQTVTAADEAKTIAPWEVGAYLLGTCATTQEAAAAIQQVRVGAAVQKDMGFVPPVHFIVTDPSGRSIVLEYVAGELKIHENPLGVMTNSPTFDWHLTNLSNYVTMSADNVGQIDLRGQVIKPLGQGSGMLGLPGDFTPPSRFVRAVAYSKSALPVDTAREGVLQAFHILNQFDIPKGSARSVENGEPVADYTLWTSASDLKNRRFYFRTFDNSRIRMVDLNSVKFDGTQLSTISMQGDEEIDDVSSKTR